MKFFPTFVVLTIFAAAGLVFSSGASCGVLSADHPFPAVVSAAGSAGDETASAADSGSAAQDDYGDYEETGDDEQEPAEDQTQAQTLSIADPLEPFNRAMHSFNDKLYFWALKPAALGYNAVVPEPARISVKNFFSNLAFPARFVSCLLQTDFKGAATEAGRFTVNTVWGIGGLLDPSSGGELNLQKQDTDLGQTLGVWGVGHGVYIVWPVFGPSSPRDSVTIAGDFFLYPVAYVRPWYAGIGVRAYEEINATSLRIGDYEALKNAAIDPYIAFRDAYIQYRYNKIQARKGKTVFATQPSEQNLPASPALPEKENE